MRINPAGGLISDSKSRISANRVVVKEQNLDENLTP